MKSKLRAVRTLLLSTLALLCAVTQVSAASSVVYVEEMRTYTDQGYVRVGHFEVNGKTAFCMEHSNESPPTGTEVSSKIYNNDKIRKILYYGWEGPEQWSGFTGYKQGITLTSLLLSETYTTAQPVGTYNFVEGLVAFRNYVNSKPAPDLDLKFDKQVVRAFYDKELDAERTENITVLGSGAGQLTVKVPSEYILHNNKTDEDLEGTVVLKPGDNFYIRTEYDYSSLKRMELKGKNKALQPIVFVTSSTALQDLTRLELAEDTAETTKLTVDWLGRVDLKLVKEDALTHEKLAGAKFRVWQLADDGQREPRNETIVTTGEDGTATLEDYLKCGRRYAVREIEAPAGYKLNEAERIIEPTGDTEVVETVMANEKQYVYIKVNKMGEKYVINSGRLESTQVPLEGVVFEVLAAEDIIGWNGKVQYVKGAVITELTTDADGVAVTEGLPPGKYSLREKKTIPGYILDKEVKIFDLHIDASKKEMTHLVTCLNKPNETEVTILKRDLKTEKPLKGAFFTITNSDGESIEIRTDRDGKAVVKNLPPGEYKLVEIKAPNGYELDKEAKSFVVESEGANSIVVIEAYNKRIETPKTGDDDGRAMMLFASVMCIACVALKGASKYRKGMKK